MNARLLVSLDPNYAQALGVATYGFARLEWDAVWCCERLKTHFITGLARKTAGVIATDLISLAAGLPPLPWAGELQSAAAEFKRLVDVRNALLHANPGSAPDGSQRLFRHGKLWSIADIDTAADEFAMCSARLNAVLHTHLASGLSLQ